ncbi:translation initiation factor eIF-3, subunit D [Corynespora cassiicola Philippines]|uniref:Eukaryotic translation initiation factor 3 subunit D n=1 Tax=Corynespora cassiicola Philippines TaxID=1448308 RepID=A0A2T2N2A6_CORCC|nr:translation initiation factor eIF-3, subunit D [Corynespora cassiicola Philippines]
MWSKRRETNRAGDASGRAIDSPSAPRVGSHSPVFIIVWWKGEADPRAIPPLENRSIQTTWRPLPCWTSSPPCPPPMAGAPPSPARPCSTASRTHPTPKPTAWVAWPTGPRERTVPGKDAKTMATETTEQVYGANQQTNPFAIQAAEEEATFSVVDNTRTSAKTRGFGRGGGTVFRGRGQRGGQAQRGGRGTFQRVGGGRGQQYDNRGGRGGRGGRRFGWRDDKPQRNRDASVQVKPDWTVVEEIDFSRLSKLNLDTGNGEDLDSYGFLYYYDRSYDKQPGAKTSERRLNVLERAAYNVTTSSDPILQELAEKDEATIFATDNVLSMLMCATKSVYSWDLVISRRGNKVFIDKRDGSNLDMVTVNENASDAPLEISEGNKDSMNSPSALMLEATHINNVFPLQVVQESQTAKVNMPHEHPFYNPEVESDPPASKAYRYRRFDLSLERDDEPLHLVVRTELDAVVKNNINGEDQYMTIKALNEFDNKAQGSGGALDWRTKLASQRGAVLATEMKNNSCKLARWAVQSILAKADTMKLGFVSRTNPKNNNDHVILGVLTNKPRDFANQMALNLNNGWGIVRTIVDMVLRMDEGKYVLVKDPNKPVLRLYNVPENTFEEDAEEVQVVEEAEEE